MKEEHNYNVALIENVRNHPLIYNPETPGYNNKIMQENVWDMIAENMGDTAQNCKTRWQGLRSCLCRHLRKTHEDPFKTPYYLGKYMEFLVPFTKTKALLDQESKLRNLNIIQKYENGESFYDGNSSNIDAEQFLPAISIREEQQKIEPEDPPSEPENQTADPSPEPPAIYPESLLFTKGSIPSPKPRRSLKRPRFSYSTPLNSRDYEENEPSSASLDALLADHKDPDLNFLKSLLPDIRKMADADKCDFKVKTLNVINEILYKK